MGFYEGEIYPGMGNNGDGFGGSGWWAIILFAMIFGWGRNGNGFGGNGGGSEVLGYELGKAATTNDVASGFTNSSILSNLNGIDSTLCQGFNGINTAILQSNNATERGISTLSYNMLTGFNTLSREIGDCCCQTQRMLERQTCDLITNQNMNTQRIMDYLQCKELEAVKAERDALRLQVSQARQTNNIISALNPQPVPAYTVPNPNCCYNNGCGTII